MTSFLSLILVSTLYVLVDGATNLQIKGDNFYINDKLTYSETASNSKVHGLLFNSRMIQGIFDDANPTTAAIWKYPDTKKWDPLRNTNEFVSNMSVWKEHHLLSFTVGLQGGMPIFKHEGDQKWIVSAFDFQSGNLNMAFFDRLSLILEEADRIGMVPIIQLFYWGQMKRFDGDNAVILVAINNALDWLMAQQYHNIIIDVANECTEKNYGGTILKCNSGNMTGTIKYMKQYIASKDVNRSSTIYIGSSLFPGVTPHDSLIEVSDVILVHGNKESPQTISSMIHRIRDSHQFKKRPVPIVFNEDQNYHFNASSNNLKSAVDGHASWGYYVQGTNDYVHGYQSPPVNWGIADNDEAGFFGAIMKYTK